MPWYKHNNFTEYYIIHLFLSNHICTINAGNHLWKIFENFITIKAIIQYNNKNKCEGEQDLELETSYKVL